MYEVILGRLIRKGPEPLATGVSISVFLGSRENQCRATRFSIIAMDEGNRFLHDIAK